MDMDLDQSVKGLLHAMNVFNHWELLFKAFLKRKVTVAGH